MQYQSSLVRKVEVRRDGRIRRPKVELDEEQVLGLRSLGMKWNKIASLLGVCEDTLRKKRQNFHQNITFSDISHDDMDDLIREILSNNPCFGERMLQGHLLFKGFNIQRSHMRGSMRRVRPTQLNFNKRRIFRRSYNVPCPNALW